MELGTAPGMTNGRRSVRALAVLVFGVGLALSSARVVGTRFEPILLIPVVLAVGVGWILTPLHLLTRAIGQAVTFAGTCVLVAYLSDGTAADAGRGLLDGPRQVVTTSWPSPRFPTIFVALAALTYLACATAIDLAMSVRWRALAIVPMLVGMVALIAVGAPDGAQWQAVLFGAAASFVLLWIGLDDRVASVRSGLLVAVAVGLAALVTTVSVTVAVADRANPRRGEAANTQLALLDPLAESAAQKAVDPPRPLYLVASPDLGQLHRWRSASLDVYNGESWSTSGRLTPVGNRLDEATGAEQVTVRVTAIRADTVLWVSAGRLLRSTSSVETDADRRVVSIVGAARPAVTVFTLEPLTDFDPATAGTMPTVQATDIENSYAPLAQTLAGDGTVADQVAQLAATLHDGKVYKLNDELPGGVQQNRIDRFLKITRAGTPAQFVTSFVLLARSLGVDARVATGYELKGDLSTRQTITTANAAAWPEVRVASGWVAVKAVPELSQATGADKAATGQSETPPPVQQFDPPKVEDANPDEQLDAPPPPAKASGWEAVRLWALRGGVFTGLLLWPVILFASIVTWKKLRRRKGLKASDPARRVSTAWTLATDALVDAGATLQNSHTNAELVEAGMKTQPAAGPPLGRLQRHADAVTFATAPCDPQRGVDAVDQLKLVESSIRNSSSRWWRWKWWLSTRSLRRRTQSPLR
jgi:hypothetical protein